MTWGGSSLLCSAQVKVKDPQSFGRTPQPLDSYNTTHRGHSRQGELLLKGPTGCLPLIKASTASCCGERNTAPTSHSEKSEIPGRSDWGRTLRQMNLDILQREAGCSSEMAPRPSQTWISQADRWGSF